MSGSRAVVQREVVDGFVWSAIPVIEVEAPGSTIALFRARSTVCAWPSHPRGTHRPPNQVTQRLAPWGVDSWAEMLTLVEPAADYSVSVVWDSDAEFVAWYVDIIRPYRRTPIGWDFADLHLDLVVAPSGAAIVKDADELADSVAHGEISAAEAEAAHVRCGELAELAADRAGIFAEPWPTWRPDPAWAVPRLSPDATAALGASPTPADHRLDLDWWLDEGAVL